MWFLTVDEKLMHVICIRSKDRIDENIASADIEPSVHNVHKYISPYKSRIDKVVVNADISMCEHGVHKYITEQMLYDFMLEAKTDKCKLFRKWVTNEVLPTIRRTEIPPKSF